ncbi:hypothetical protein BgiBS90_028851 [Biomphalaria glabrata]|nr:hypothetical protein BgiBS90_028851 [Biomphalaria glabrata]
MDHISAFPVTTGAQAPQDGARETLNSLRRGYKESPRSYLSSAKIFVPVKRDKSKIHRRPIARKLGLPQHHSGEGGARSHTAQSQRFGPQTQQTDQHNSQDSKQSRGVTAEKPISSSITKNADSNGAPGVTQVANLKAIAIERSTHSASAPINTQGTGTATIVLPQDTGINGVLDIASSATMVASDIVRGIKPLGATETHPRPLITRSSFVCFFCVVFI